MAADSPEKIHVGSTIFWSLQLFLAEESRRYLKTIPPSMDLCWVYWLTTPCSLSGGRSVERAVFRSPWLSSCKESCKGCAPHGQGASPHKDLWGVACHGSPGPSLPKKNCRDLKMVPYPWIPQRARSPWRAASSMKIYGGTHHRSLCGFPLGRKAAGRFENDACEGLLPRLLP